MMRQEEQLLEAFLEQKGAGKRATATSRRHQVTTWRSTKTEVNHSPRRDVPTSRRPHVATSPRRDVPTPRRPHVATSPRRDVTTSRRQLKILHLIIKCEGARESRALKNVRPETRIWRTCNTDLKNILGFLYWILFICLIIFGSYDGVLHTLYFVSLLHDVLNSFLGLHQTLSQTMD